MLVQWQQLASAHKQACKLKYCKAYDSSMSNKDSKTVSYMSFLLAIVPVLYLFRVYLLFKDAMHGGGMVASFLLHIPAILIFSWVEVIACGLGIFAVLSNLQGRAYAFWGITLSSAYLMTLWFIYGEVLLQVLLPAQS